MSFLSYIAADIPIPASALLWPLSIGGEAGEIEIWRIWQGVEYRPVIRTKVISVNSLAVEDLRELESKDVANETTTSYGIPVQHRIVVSI